jgi:phenylalanyl-tRNA synthetase beta chain
MHLQDKLDQTYGRSRQKTSIGLYNFDLISPPLNYVAAKPNDFSFVPLGFEEEMTLSEILQKHPKGIEYANILNKNDRYPLLYDSKQKILSFPPIINSNDLGKVTEKTRNLLVEVTGTMYQTTLNTLNLVTLAIIDQGGNSYSATINYPEDKFYQIKKDTTPVFKSRNVRIDIEYLRKMLGLELDPEKIVDLLLMAGLGVEKIGETFVEVIVPCYRVDVMHQVDLIEDVAIAYGYNNIEPLWRDLPTTGSRRPEQSLIDTTRGLMVGLGYQETLNYTLTSLETLFEKMNLEKQKVVELINPKVVTMTCLRNWLLPSLIEFLSNNQSVEFPQKIFELGTVTLLDKTTETLSRDEFWLAGVTTHPTAGFTEVKSVLDSLFMNLGTSWSIEKTFHSSFIDGRIGKIIVDKNEVGVLGEINPQVLENWKLENPAAAFEVNLHKILFSDS